MDRQKLIDLETRLAFQEDTILTLSDVVARQQRQIEQLEKTCETLVDRVRNLSIEMKIEFEQNDEKPPHY